MPWWALRPTPPGGGYAGEGRKHHMCLDCGCGEPNERHGDERHIVMDDVRAAAEASEISVDEAARNISQGLSQTQKSASSAD
jgi:hypothetical protein